MTPTPLSRALNVCASAALVTGIGLTAVQASLYANATGGGASLYSPIPHQEEATLRPAAGSVPVAYPLEAADAGIQLIIGILFILLGFFVHALARTRTGERPVRVTAVPPMQRRQRTWIWMNMRV